MLGCSQVAALQVSDFDALWRDYVAAFGGLIRQADHDAQSAAAKQMVRTRQNAAGTSGSVGRPAGTGCACSSSTHSHGF